MSIESIILLYIVFMCLLFSGLIHIVRKAEDVSEFYEQLSKLNDEMYITSKDFEESLREMDSYEQIMEVEEKKKKLREEKKN